MKDTKSIAVDIERIKNKITQKGIDLGKPLLSNNLKDFENQHKVVLPREYREFLLNIGNGGDGPPYYGLNTLAESIADRMHPSQQFPLST